MLPSTLRGRWVGTGAVHVSRSFLLVSSVLQRVQVLRTELVLGEEGVRVGDGGSTFGGR